MPGYKVLKIILSAGSVLQSEPERFGSGYTPRTGKSQIITII